jgi:hypothetical protein
LLVHGLLLLQVENSTGGSARAPIVNHHIV